MVPARGFSVLRQQWIPRPRRVHRSWIRLSAGHEPRSIREGTQGGNSSGNIGAPTLLFDWDGGPYPREILPNLPLTPPELNAGGTSSCAVRWADIVCQAARDRAATGVVGI